MADLLATGTHVLKKERCPHYPFRWYADHGPDYRAQGRNDGLVYIGGFRTHDEAKAWAAKQDIIPEPKDDDPQGEL